MISFRNKNIFKAAIAGCVAVTAVVFNIMERIIKQRTTELQEKNADIQESIDYAKVIQTAMMPSDDELHKVLGESFVIWRPRDTVGGDFYWLRALQKGYLVIVGDCTGHGVPGALMTMSVAAMLDHIVDEICDDDPARILEELERLMKHAFLNSGSEVNLSDGLDAGVLYVSNDNRILFAGARNPLFVADGTGITEIPGNHRMIDGSSPGQDKPFVNKEVKVHDGMTLYMATDGFYEQPGGEKGFPLGREKMKSILLEHSSLEIGQQGDLIMQQFENYVGVESLRDDLTLLGIRIRSRRNGKHAASL